MIATPIEIGAAIGATNLVINGTESNPHVISCDGLPLEVAQQRVTLIAKSGKLWPDAELYQINEWLIREGIEESDVEVIITANITDPVEQKVAIMRFRKVPKVPKDHPLAIMVAAAKGINLDAVWWTILSY